MRGFFIVFEGIDGSGKTTLAKDLCATLALHSVPCTLTAEHTHGPIGERIDAILTGKALVIDPLELQRLFVLDRKDHIESVLSPALMAGECVISDRYWLSTIAYSMLSFPQETFITIHEEILGKNFLRPDLTILIDVPADIAIARIAKTRGEVTIFEKIEKLEKLRANYLALARTTDPRIGRLQVVDGSQPFEAVRQAVWDAARKSLRVSSLYNSTLG